VYGNIFLGKIIRRETLMRRIITFIIFIILITFTLAGNARAENTSSGNLALNKSYTKSEEPRADYPDTGHESTDGILAGEYNEGNLMDITFLSEPVRLLT
jgi:hypothetical protein